MLKCCFLWLLIVFLLAGCTHHQKVRPTALASYSGSSTQHRQTATFNQLDVQGAINVTLHTGYKHPEVVLTGDPRDLAQVKTQVAQNTLYIACSKGYPQFGAINAEVKGRFLNDVYYKGEGAVNGDHLHTRFLNLYLENQGRTKLAGSIGLQHLVVVGNGLTQINGINSPNLQVSLKGSPKVQLTGMANLSKLTINGNGWLSLYWIKSDHLTINGKKGAKIQLAGIANQLDLELWDTAQFKGRYLRAKRSFVKTHDQAVAEISAVHHQSSLATDASDIYYYNIPDTRADFMALNGSVLDMREWNEYNMEDFTRYNKQFP